MNICLNCGMEIEQKPKTRTKKYCNATCKMRAYYARQSAPDYSNIKTKEQKKEMKEIFTQAKLTKPLSRIEQMKKLRK